MLTLCERSKNYLLMAKLPHEKNPEKAAETVIRLLFPFQKNVLTITTDNGNEFACHEKITKALGRRGETRRNSPGTSVKKDGTERGGSVDSSLSHSDTCSFSKDKRQRTAADVHLFFTERWGRGNFTEESKAPKTRPERPPLK